MKTKYQILLLICITLFSGLFIYGQTTKKDECKDQKSRVKAKKYGKKTRTKETKPRFVTAVSAPAAPSAPKIYKYNYKTENKKFSYKRGDDFTEKSLKVNPKVLVQLCALSGEIKVNGWKRDEVRVFVENGGPVGFKVRQKNRKSKKASWVDVLGYDLKSRTGARGNKCLSGKMIEIDVPYNAEVKIEGRESQISVDSIRKVNLHTHRGGVFVANVKNGVEARTYQGNVSVRRSNGRMFLSTTSGNVVAFKTDVNEIGDYFKAKSQSGAITMQAVDQRELDIKTTSGAINYFGELNSGGQYTFYSSSGSITLGLPGKSSFQTTASSGVGRFNSDIRLKNKNLSKGAGVQTLIGTAGSGDSVLYLTTFTGYIRIRQTDPIP